MEGLGPNRGPHLPPPSTSKGSTRQSHVTYTFTSGHSRFLPPNSSSAVSKLCNHLESALRSESPETIDATRHGPGRYAGLAYSPTSVQTNILLGLASSMLSTSAWVSQDFLARLLNKQ